MGSTHMNLLPDQRDATKEPPAYLDPVFVLRNRKRVQKYLATGEFTWPKGEVLKDWRAIPVTLTTMALIQWLGG